jgi:16S rRNA processing protein RimM
VSDTGESPGLVQVGRVRQAHGLSGVLVVEMLHEAADVVLAPGRRVFAGNVRGDPVDPPVALSVLMAEPFKNGLRVQLAEITDKPTADTWRGRYLLAPAGEIPEPDVDAMDPAELIGLSVELATGEVVGTVEAYYPLKHDLLIEVARSEGSVLVPFRPEFVQEVDSEAGRIVIAPPEGLL